MYYLWPLGLAVCARFFIAPWWVVVTLPTLSNKNTPCGVLVVFKWLVTTNLFKNSKLTAFIQAFTLALCYGFM